MDIHDLVSHLPLETYGIMIKGPVTLTHTLYLTP